ncbi:MAG: hypothetical protein FWF88_06125 [Peptococcaceae bacterium]|jgi:hypothetical protein|nr:hypothetical protein [Peptococcaceae bacterium]MDR2736201.1 hypothetical protein [Gracilibacteraceae bacterium]
MAKVYRIYYCVEHPHLDNQIKYFRTRKAAQDYCDKYMPDSMPIEAVFDVEKHQSDIKMIELILTNEEESSTETEWLNRHDT